MKFRHDIQALRGFAVVLILLFHAQIGPLKAGYLGVDIFFVISGFLISTLLVKHLEQGDFSFKEFYFRRIRRLLPAAYVTLFFTCIGSIFFLTSTEYKDFQNQLIGSLTFTANFALLDQSDYFDGDAKLKPLLHMWSLAIEEQYYLLLPAALFFAPRKLWVPAAAAFTLASFFGCLILAAKEPEAAFYLLPSRAWELGIGSLGALYLQKAGFQKIYKILFWPSLAAIFLLPIFPFSKSHPGIDALLICVATLIVILRQAPIANKTLPAKILSKIGDYSYSLYLVHWPLFAFANNGYLGMTPDLQIRLGLLTLSILLAALFYHLVENPFRKLRFQHFKPVLVSAVSGAVLLVLLSFLYPSHAGPDYKKLRRPNVGLAKECSYGSRFKKLNACQSGENPQILVWGDSHAMHLVQGLGKTTDQAIYQATKSSCGPFLGSAQIALPKYPKDWAKDCISFNDSVLQFLADSPSIKIVVLSSTLSAQSKTGTLGLIQNEDGYAETMMTPESSLKALSQTVEKIHSLGKKVVFVSSPPSANFDISLCLERFQSGKVILGENKNCPLPEKTAFKNRAGMYAFIEKMEETNAISVIRLADHLCENGQCPTMLDNHPLYRDRHHLSYEGSEAMARKIGLVDLILKEAK